MCGIAGIWTTQCVETVAGRVSAAVRVLGHRGPDDRGQAVLQWRRGNLVLAHTRLSIIDLTAGGHQPMQRPDRRYTIVYNGEVYNYRELRQELCDCGQRFATQSDTEVVLAAWERWQEGALCRLKGMFAFCVYDSVTNTLTLARDAFGIKPLYYAACDGTFAFASELDALRTLLPDLCRLNPQRAYDYLVFGSYDDQENSFVRDVRHLLPGHLLTFDLAAGKAQSPERWWWPSADEESELTFDDAVSHVREMFLRNVRLHLRSDVRIGAALSGGIDSSAVVCGMRHVEPDLPVHTFSYVARGAAVDEERWADLVNQHVGAVPHKVTASAAELVADLDDMIRAQGEPFGSTSIYAQYRVFRLAADQGVTVVLEGQGADELLAGYHGYPGARLRGLLENLDIAGAARFTLAWSRWPGRTARDAVVLLGREIVPPRFQGAARALLGRTAEPSWLNIPQLRDAGVRCVQDPAPSEFGAPGRRLAAALRQALVSSGLPALLRHSDRNSMHWSVESRVPFLTTDVAEFVLGLPEHFLISREGRTKNVFRAAMRGIVPDAILDRRDKIGFATPEQEWLLSSPATIREWLRLDLGLQFFNQARAVSEFDEIVAGKKRFSLQVWRWINFVRWYVNCNVRP